MPEFLKNLPPQLYYVIPIFAAMFIAQIVVMVARKKKAKAIEAANPHMAKLYLSYKVGVASSAMTLHSIDNHPVETFNDKLSIYCYAEPGLRTLELSYETTRPGVMYKTVSKTYGPVKIEVELEGYKSYKLSFDKKTEQFTVTEVE